MKEMGLEGILNEIAKIDSKEGINFIIALLLNELMKKEREIRLIESLDNKANGYYERQLAFFRFSWAFSSKRQKGRVPSFGVT